LKPKLKNDTLYIPSQEGVFLVNNSGSLTIPGRHVYQWIDRLAPYLTGDYTLADITEGLSEDRRAMVTKIVEALVEKGYVKDVAGDLPHGLSKAEEAAYAAEIAFIDYYRDSGAHQFEKYRDTRILLLGSGLVLSALVQANLHSGNRSPYVLVTGENPTDAARHRDYLALARERDPEQSLVEEHDLAAVERADVVIHVSDRPMLARARELNRMCAEQGKIFIQAVVDGEQAWIGPILRPGAEGPCWECAWLRLDAGADFADRPEQPVGQFLAGPTAAMVANLMSFEVFKLLTGAGPLETDAALVGLDLETLSSTSHSLTRHPLCSAHGPVAAQSEADFRESVRRLTDGAPIDQETFSTRAATLFDARTGLLRSLDEESFSQVPLKVSKAVPAGAPAAVEVGDDFTAARHGATMRACALYAGNMLDRRRLPSPDTVWALDLGTGEALTVPVGLAFPGEPGPGLAAGFSWAECVGRGLLGHCVALTLAELGRAAEPYPMVELDETGPSEAARRYLKMLDIAGEKVTVYDATGALGVPMLLACTDGRTVGCAGHPDPGKALTDVLSQAVQHYQATANGQPEYAPRGLPELPQHLRGSSSRPLPEATERDRAEIHELLLGRLAGAGLRPVAIPLDHDPVMSAVLPYIVNVVLPGDE
jgi:putative thiazole-containing bacteriocin maturation protein